MFILCKTDEQVAWLLFSREVNPRAWLYLAHAKLPKILEIGLAPLEILRLVIHFVLPVLNVDPA